MKGQFGRQDNQPKELTGSMIDQKIDYIHANPVKSGFVNEERDYLYSSARNYAGDQGLLEVDIIERDYKGLSPARS